MKKGCWCLEWENVRHFARFDFKTCYIFYLHVEREAKPSCLFVFYFVSHAVIISCNTAQDAIIYFFAFWSSCKKNSDYRWKWRIIVAFNSVFIFLWWEWCKFNTWCLPFPAYFRANYTQCSYYFTYEHL